MLNFLSLTLSGTADPFAGKFYLILLPLGLILLFGKVFSLIMGKLKVPKVVGYLLGGLAVGLFYFIPSFLRNNAYTSRPFS